MAEQGKWLEIYVLKCGNQNQKQVLWERELEVHFMGIRSKNRVKKIRNKVNILRTRKDKNKTDEKKIDTKWNLK